MAHSEGEVVMKCSANVENISRLSDDDNKLAERMASMCKTTRMSGNLKNTKF